MEKVSKFGSRKNLIGIYSPARGPCPIGNDIALLILNSGLVHRAGPFRGNTELARFLSHAGINVFRFDMSGIGDSEVPKNDKRPYRERFSDDIGEAIDFLRSRYRINQIIVLGLCTGAELAHYAAVKYSSIIGSILLDGYGYPTRRFLIRRYAPAFMDIKRMGRAALKIIGKLFAPGGSGGESSLMEDYLWELPDKNDYIAQMHQLNEKNVRQLFIYTGGVKNYYNYKNQFYDCFGDYPFANDVTVEYFENADHTFIILGQRRELFEILFNWIRQTFAPDTTASEDMPPPIVRTDVKLT